MRLMMVALIGHNIIWNAIRESQTTRRSDIAFTMDALADCDISRLPIEPGNIGIRMRIAIVALGLILSGHISNLFQA